MYGGYFPKEAGSQLCGGNRCTMSRGTERGTYTIMRSISLLPDILRQISQPYVREHRNFIFQLDNAKPYDGQRMLTYPETEGVRLLLWPIFLQICHPLKAFGHEFGGDIELSAFCSVNEYLRHHIKMIIALWRLLLVYIDNTPTPAIDSANRLRMSVNPYDAQVEKLECIELFQKYMGTHLLDLKSETGRKKVNAGAGVYCHLFSFYLTTGKFTTAFDGEVAALQVALAQLYCHLNSFTRAVVFCDSKAAIFAVNSNSPPDSSSILDCKKLLQSLSEYSKQIVLQWIPGHCSVAAPFHPNSEREHPGVDRASYLSSLSTNLTRGVAAQRLLRPPAAQALYIYKHPCLLQNSKPGSTVPQSASPTTTPDSSKFQSKTRTYTSAFLKFWVNSLHNANFFYEGTLKVLVQCSNHWKSGNSV
ncbi:hypothetical protein TNCV_5088441 [Trichonephila clavipes]|nr:hypothetical protein TNCV_5088441 [Trichonephila clavipes]